MSSDDERVHSTEEWNRIDRGEVDPEPEEPEHDPLHKTDDAGNAPPMGAGSEPPD
jgi:hypothetical protein